MENKIIPYEKLGLSNDYIFAKAMRNARLCKRLLEIILDIEIEKIEYPEEQKVIDEKVDARSVRLDIYVRDGKNTVYNIEIQTTNPRNLPKRSRYYQSMIDLHLIEKGADFNELNKSYVIFICMEDIFHKGRHIYTFENICKQDTKIYLKDATTKVFLNPHGKIDDISSDLKNFLIYLVDGTVSDDFTKELEQEVTVVRNNEEWRREYMTLLMRDRENQEIGKEIGKEIGRMDTLVGLVEDGIITIAQAANQAKMTVEEFTDLLKK